MLMKSIALLLVMTSSVSAFDAARVTVGNSSSTKITNCFTQLPQAPTIFVQLYFTPDLSAVTNREARSFMLPAGAPLTLFRPGIFLSSQSTIIPGVVAGGSVVAQLRAWTTNYSTFAEAAAQGGEVAMSLVWVQPTAGGINPPPLIRRWGFLPFKFPTCEPEVIPLIAERGTNGSLRIAWPVGSGTAIQESSGSRTNWTQTGAGSLADDHWEFTIQPTNSMGFFRLGQ